MTTIRAFIADDHPIVIRGLQNWFDEYNSVKPEHLIKVVGYELSAAKLLSNVRRSDIDVFITDLRFADTRGDISIIASILKKRPDARIVVFSMRRNPLTIAACYRAGAKACITKNDEPLHLVHAIVAAASDNDYFVPAMLEQIGLASIRSPLNELSERDARLFILLAQQTDIKVIEKELGITEKTISNIVANSIKPVLGVTRKDFHTYALKAGLIDDIE